MLFFISLSASNLMLSKAVTTKIFRSRLEAAAVVLNSVTRLMVQCSHKTDFKIYFWIMNKILKIRFFSHKVET